MDDLSKKFIKDMFNDKFEKEIAEIIMSEQPDMDKLLSLINKMEDETDA